MKRRASSLGLLLALGRGVAGCGGESPAEPLELSVVLGTGQAVFEPMQGEPELTLVAGTQGGFHVWASFLAYNYTAPLLGTLLVTTVDGVPDSRLVMRANLATRETTDADGNIARTFPGFPAQVYNARCAHGRRVQLDITLTDADGRSAEDTRYCIASVAPELRSMNCE